MSRALRELERDLAAMRQTRAAVEAGDVVDMEDPAVHATEDSWFNRPSLFVDMERMARGQPVPWDEEACAADDAARHARVRSFLVAAAARESGETTFLVVIGIGRGGGDLDADERVIWTQMSAW